MYVPQPTHDDVRNINMMERWLSMIGGGALTTMGLRRGGLRGFVMSLAGGYLAQRGLSGHCEVYRALGMNTAGYLPHESESYEQPAEQAEGKRTPHKKATKVGPTPGSAEGDRETVEADLRSKAPKPGL